MNAALLALLVGAVYFAPAHIASWAHWSTAAVEYVAYGIESAVLWAALGWQLHRRSKPGKSAFLWVTVEPMRWWPWRWRVPLLVDLSVPGQAVCAWGAFEAVQRPICRCMFDLSHKVPLLAGQTLCEAAFGIPIGWLGFAVAGGVIMWSAGRSR